MINMRMIIVVFFAYAVSENIRKGNRWGENRFLRSNRIVRKFSQDSILPALTLILQNARMKYRMGIV